MPHLDPHIDSRETILTAAARLFVEFGHRGIAMRQIAEAVGVTKAALYYYFSDKSQILLRCFDLGFEVAEVALDGLPKRVVVRSTPTMSDFVATYFEDLSRVWKPSTAAAPPTS